MGGEVFGARWWKFDFHTHTPASADYGKGPDHAAHRKVAPRDWLLDFMRAGIDCVAVTDHNTGGWIGELQTANGELEEERPEGFRPLFLFPGVELTVHGGYHLLAIFDPGARKDDVTALLGAVDVPGGMHGNQQALANVTITEAAAKVAEHGGLPIPAHVDRSRGILGCEEDISRLDGRSLATLYRSPFIHAVEVVSPDFSLPPSHADHGAPWAAVLGSDCHHPSGSSADVSRQPGGRYTWVKMGGPPSLEGLRLALLDQAPWSLRRSDSQDGDPNRWPALVIERLEIDKAQYAGREEPLSASFSPWLTAIIGGRGSGKSTLVEMLRLGLRREGDLPERVREETDHFRRVQQSRQLHGALTAETRLTLFARKEGERFRIRWRQAGAEGPEIERLVGDGAEPSPGEVAERFKVRILSQKQVFEMASDEGSLLRHVDESLPVSKREWTARYEEARALFLELRSRERTLAATLADRERLEGELEDVKRKLAILEESGERDVLVRYRRYTRQRRALDDRRRELLAAIDATRGAAETAEPSDLDETLFAVDDAAQSGLGLLRQLSDRQRELASALTRLADGAETRVEKWDAAVAESEWAAGEERSVARYAALSEAVQGRAGPGPADFGELVQTRQEVESRLAALAKNEEELERVRRRAEGALRRVDELRRELTANRVEFLGDALSDNEFVQTRVLPYGEGARATEAGFREAIGRDSRLNDILSEDGERGVLADLYRDLPAPADERREELLERVDKLKRKLLFAEKEDGALGEWLRKHALGLSREQRGALEMWWPEDALHVEYRSDGEKGFKPIAQGSPGQKSAALLAFLLSYGEEPIVLDQPEDDLDNRLITELVVTQLRRTKLNRQIVVVTHNPNIVVNGDAEAVLSMDRKGGQCRVLEDASGCLQDQRVRDEVCKVMEGGREAFERRYRRLHVDVPDAG